MRIRNTDWFSFYLGGELIVVIVISLHGFTAGSSIRNGRLNINNNIKIAIKYN
jgi:hypothetical protein